MKLGTKYDVAVRTIISGKYTGKWTFAVFETKRYTPANITGLKVKKTTKNTASLTWNKSKNATRYKVMWKAVGAKGKSKTMFVNGNSATLKNLKPNTKYQVYVRAYNVNTVGKWSGKIIAATKR